MDIMSADQSFIIELHWNPNFCFFKEKNTNGKVSPWTIGMSTGQPWMQYKKTPVLKIVFPCVCVWYSLIHVCVCTYVCRWLCPRVLVHMEAKGWFQVSTIHIFFFFEAVALLDSRGHKLSCLAGQQTPGIYPISVLPVLGLQMWSDPPDSSQGH